MKTLGICIPTYKRPQMLLQCIESAIASARGCQIAIYVADDSVSDINAGVVTKLQQEYPFVHYSRNPTNLGIDRNIQQAVGMSECDFSWIIGEDDQFLPGAVERMCGLIQRTDVPFVFVNYQYVSEDHGRVIGLALPAGADSKQSAQEFIANSLWAIGFIGGCVVQRQSWVETSPEPYRDTYFTHVGRIIEMLSKTPEVQVCATPGVANRAQGEDTFTWKKDSFGVFLGFERMCRIAAKQVPRLSPSLTTALTNYRRKFAYFSFKTSFRLRSEGAFDFRQYKRYITSAEIGRGRKAWFLLMATIPPAVLRPLAKLYVGLAARRAQRRMDA